MISKMNNDILEFVSSVIINENGNVLLLKRKSDLKLDAGKYDLCSGHMKKGEVPIQTMLREMREEIGLKHEEIKRVDKLGDIPTPHEQFLDKTCHMFLVEVKIEEKEINERIKNVEQPEMDRAIYLDDINLLRYIQKYTNLMRTIPTDEEEKIFRLVQEKINERKELEFKKCQEER
jgi:8-oxo-dGTP pyrophosphatase MutT (NUDIX family)